MMRKTAISRGMSDANTFSCANNREVLETLKNMLREEDTVLLKGSRLMRLNEVADAILSFVSVKGDMVRV